MATAELLPTRKWGRIVIANLSIVTGMIWAWTGMREIRTGVTAGYAVFDFIMTAACIVYGVAFLKWRREDARKIWSEIGIIILAGGPNLRGAIKGIKGGDITFDGAMSLVFVGFCIVLLLVALKSRQHLGQQTEAK